VRELESNKSPSKSQMAVVEDCFSKASPLRRLQPSTPLSPRMNPRCRSYRSIDGFRKGESVRIKSREPEQLFILASHQCAEEAAVYCAEESSTPSSRPEERRPAYLSQVASRVWLFTSSPDHVIQSGHIPLHDPFHSWFYADRLQ
jgi:hypothetical protein